MNRYLFLFAALAGLLVDNLHAGSMGHGQAEEQWPGPMRSGHIGPPAQPLRNWAWIAAVSAGPVWLNSAERETIRLSPNIIKTYDGENTNDVLAVGEFFIGIQKALSTSWQAQFGMALFASTSAEVQGTIWDDADPQFDNYSYHYNINHTKIAAKAKLLLDKNLPVLPWVSFNLGVSFNRASDFDNQPLIFQALPNNNFLDKNTTSFSYGVGVGIQRAFGNHMQIGIGYQFADWGKSQLARAKDQNINSGPALNHLYTNGIMLNITAMA